MSAQICRWGIVGTATIAEKNWKALWNAPNCTVTAVASRDLKRAKVFIAKCQALVPFDPPPRACGSYEELLAREDVDAVYVPLPTGIRRQWAIGAAEAGKHVLCEKPAGVNAEEVAAIIEACERHRVQFMDGVMFMHSARLGALRDILEDGESLGKIKRITSQFSFFASAEWLESNIRTQSELEPHGVLGDLGWYNIRFTLWALKYRMPERVSGRILTELGQRGSPAPVPVEFSGELFFADGVSASYYASFLTEHQQWVKLSGTKGAVYVPDFVVPNFGNELIFELSKAFYDVSGCNFNMEDYSRRIAVPEFSNGMPNAQETHMVGHFATLVLSGKTDPIWGEIALKTQKVLDVCLSSARSGGRLVELVE